MRVLTILIALFISWPMAQASGRTYRYTDKEGVVHLTDSLSTVPDDQLPDVQPMGGAESDAGTEASEKAPGQGDPGIAEDQNQPEVTETEREPGTENEIPFIDNLKTERAALETEHTRLEKEKASLQEEKKNLKTPEQVKAYQKKVNHLNREIDEYKKRNRAFQKKADAFNEAVKEEEK